PGSSGTTHPRSAKPAARAAPSAAGNGSERHRRKRFGSFQSIVPTEAPAAPKARLLQRGPQDRDPQAGESTGCDQRKDETADRDQHASDGEDVRHWDPVRGTPTVDEPRE